MDRERRYQGWIAVFESSTDYEAEMVRDRLDSAGLPAVVLTQRDHAFNLTFGDLARVYVMVPPEAQQRAIEIIQDTFTEEELEMASRQVEPDNPPLHVFGNGSTGSSNGRADDDE